MADYREIAAKLGVEIVNAGAFAGRKLVNAYKAVDPDVMRHAAQLPLLSYTLFASREAVIDPGVPDGHPPLILVHGLGGDRGNLLPMAWYLWFRGRKRSYRIHFTPDMSIQQMAAALADFIKAVLKTTGEDRVELVAHSLGGIAARFAITEWELEDSVQTLITLGTPHKGTYAARYANTDALRELRPDSRIIKMLEEYGWPPGVRGVTMYSENDLLVIPPEFAVVEGAEQVDMSPFTHYSYLVSPRSWAATAKALSE